MSKASINFKPCISTSETHNLREEIPNYVILSKDNNESWMLKRIEDARKEIVYLAKKVGGRKLQKNCNPIKEAVVNLKPETTIDDLRKLGDVLNEAYKINLIQIHIHRDEGHRIDDTNVKINHHAHLVFDWQNKATGKIVTIGRADMSKVQTLTAETLGMERGQVNSKAERLEHGEFREAMNELNRQIDEKKNDLQQTEIELQQSEQDLIHLNETLRKARLAFGYTIEELNAQFKEQLKALIAQERAARIERNKLIVEASKQAVKQPDSQVLRDAKKAVELATKSIEQFKEGLAGYTVYFKGFKLTTEHKYDLLIGKPQETLYNELTAPKQAKIDEDDRQHKRGLKR